MNDNEREQIIRQAITAYKEDGITITSNTWGVDWSKTKKFWVPKKDNCCCALGCVLLNNQKSLDVNIINLRDWSVEKILDVSHNWIRNFQLGFDGYGTPPDDVSFAYELGIIMRAEYVAKQ